MQSELHAELETHEAANVATRPPPSTTNAARPAATPRGSSGCGSGMRKPLLEADATVTPPGYQIPQAQAMQRETSSQYFSPPVTNWQRIDHFNIALSLPKNDCCFTRFAWCDDSLAKDGSLKTKELKVFVPEDEKLLAHIEGHAGAEATQATERILRRELSNKALMDSGLRFADMDSSLHFNGSYCPASYCCIGIYATVCFCDGISLPFAWPTMQKIINHPEMQDTIAEYRRKFTTEERVSLKQDDLSYDYSQMHAHLQRIIDTKINDSVLAGKLKLEIVISSWKTVNGNLKKIKYKLIVSASSR